MNTRFLYFGRLVAISLAVIAVLFASFSSYSASAAPLKVTCPTNPSVPNDDIDCATVITALPYQDTSITDVTQATPNGADPGPGDDPQITECNSDAGKQTVWYQYIAASSGEMHVDTIGSTYDAVLAVWAGTRGNLTLITCSEKVVLPSTSQSEVRFPVESGKTYYFEVAQFAVSLATSLSAQSAVTTTSNSNNSLILNASFRSTSTSNLAPSTPSLLAPANGATVTTYKPNLDWSNTTLKSGTYFYKYELQVSNNSTFSPTVFTQRIFDLGSSNYAKYLPPVSSLDPNTKYYWRVRACNANGTAGQCSAWTAARYFRTAIRPPDLVSPTDGFPEQVLRPDFDWNDVTGAGSYNIQISKASNFSTLLVNTNATVSAFTPKADLPSGSTLYWRVRANASSGNFGPSGWSSPARKFFTPKPPSIPVLASPTNGALVTNRLPTLDWNNSTVPSGGAAFDHYEIQIADNSGFTGISLIDDNTATGNITASNYTPASPLNPNTKYYWRVRSFDVSSNISSWSAVWTFREAFDPPVLSDPVNLLALKTLRTIFNWSDVTGASGYNIQISKYNTFSTLVTNVNVVPSTYTPTVDLPANSTLYWRVRTNGANGPSLWSSTWSFTTPNPPSIPMLVSPANGALVTNRQPALDWKNSTLPSGVTTFGHYQVQVATDITFTSPVIDYSTAAGDLTASQFTDYNYTSPGVPGPLAPNTKYYWRVRSWDSADESGNYSSWSAVWSFREAIDPPTSLTPTDGTVVNNLRPAFDWSDVNGASGYNIQASKVNTFSTLVLNVNISGVSNSTYTPTANLPGGSKLYWRVRANGANGPSDWAISPPFGSIITPNGPPLLSAPVNASVVTTTTPTLSWVVPSLAPGTTFDYYQVQVAAASDPTFASPLVDDTSLLSATPSQFTVPSSILSVDSLYYWRVSFFYKDASLNSYQTAWSSTWSFKTPIADPVLVDPPDDPTQAAPIADLTPTFDWNNVTGAASYTIQVSTDPSFATTVINATVSGNTNSTYTPGSNLLSGTAYYWRVRANAMSGYFGPSPWSTVWTFTTQ